MRAAGLVDTRRSGREVLYEARPEALRQPADWLTDHAAAWSRRLGDLKQRAEATATTNPGRTGAGQSH